MILRFLNAVLIGVLAGIVLSEALLAAVTQFQGGMDPITALIHSGFLSPLETLLLLLCWILGATTSAMLAARLARHQSAAALCAGLWLVPMLLTIGLSPASFPLFFSAAAISLLAWLLARRFITVDKHSS